jgi:hypothetical protein
MLTSLSVDGKQGFRQFIFWEEPKYMLINFLYYPFLNVRTDRFRIRVLTTKQF